MDINKTKVAKYALLPGVLPRLANLVTSGFSTLAYYVAKIYNLVKLLPDDHPYLKIENTGKYGIRNVIAQAADNLVFKWKNFDQILIFFTILIGLILIALQIILFLAALIASQSAFATANTPVTAAFNFGILEMFQNPSPNIGSLGPTQDLAFIILDRVFGLHADNGGTPLYNSCIAQNILCNNNAGNPIPAVNSGYPYPFHEALHFMLRFYSTGILLISVFIFIYFTITVVGETAASGTPFGQRFNRAWAPIRFVLFFGMLIPLNIGGANAGLNGAQHITFVTAKWGSNFATNGWVYFNTQLSTALSASVQPSAGSNAEVTFGDGKSIIAEPNIPESVGFLQTLFTAKTCAIAERVGQSNPLDIYIVRPEPPSAFSTTAPPTGHSISQNARELLTIADYRTAKAFALEGDIFIRIGKAAEDTAGSGVIEQQRQYSGNIKPYCGEFVLRSTADTTIDAATGAPREPGAAVLEEAYFDLIRTLWQNQDLIDKAECLAYEHSENNREDCTSPDAPDANFVEAMVTGIINPAIQTAIRDAIIAQEGRAQNTLVEKGWAGAAIWYNRVAEMNGIIINAAANLPVQTQFPMAMEIVREERQLQNASLNGANMFSLQIADGRDIELEDDRHIRSYPAIFEAYRFFEEGDFASTSDTSSTGNAFIDTINLLLGTQGLFEMRTERNQNTHPLAQLTAVGKGMIQTIEVHLAITIAGRVAGGLQGILGDVPAQFAQAAANFSSTVIFSTLAIGAILYYVLPFLPFIYFMFAVSGWVKSIFEAVVAMPLWALAHIRIDGEGIPGQDAANGYFLLLEIFLRPILILFGLIASISIFGALIGTLNNIFDLVVPNVAGFSPETEEAAGAAGSTIPTAIESYRGAIDQFFFTVMYAIICYIMGLSCFKLIDLVPNNILRWIGSTVATFQENAGDPAGQLTNNVYRGSTLVANQVRGATQSDLPFLTG